jgi:hypothetical protein
VQRGFEHKNWAVDLASVVGVGERRIYRHMQTRELSSVTSASRRVRVFALAASMAADADAAADARKVAI